MRYFNKRTYKFVIDNHQANKEPRHNKRAKTIKHTRSNLDLYFGKNLLIV